MTLPSLKKIDKLLDSRISKIKEEKAKGKKLVGFFCSYIPEEIIWALGMIPVRLCRFGDNQVAAIGATYLTANACPFARSCVGLKKEGKDEYFNLVDIVVDAPACLQMRRVLEVWEKYFGMKVIMIPMPRKFYTPDGQSYYANSVEHFTKELAGQYNIKLDDERFKKAVELFNGIRKHLRLLYDELKKDDPAITWDEVTKVIQAGFLLDKEQYLQTLRELVDEMNAHPHGSNTPSKVRLLLAGGMIAPGDEKLTKILKDINGNVVMDELCTGSRSIYGDIEEPTFESISKRYLEAIPCGSLPYPKLDDDPRHEHLTRLLKDYNINGVIYYTLRFCDAYTFKVGHIQKILKSMGIPFLHINSDQSGSDVHQVRTRVEAFVESIRERI